MSGKGWKSDQLTGKFLAGNFSQSQTELSADFTGLIAPDWFRGPGTLTSAELEAGAFDADEAKDYATETIQQHLKRFHARLSVMLQTNHIKVMDARYGLEHADMLLDLETWMKVPEVLVAMGEGTYEGRVAISDISIRAGCGEAECHGQYPTKHATPILLYGYRFKWSPFLQGTVTAQRGAPEPPRDYPDFPLVNDGCFLAPEAHEKLYASDPEGFHLLYLAQALSRYNALTRREP